MPTSPLFSVEEFEKLSQESEVRLECFDGELLVAQTPIDLIPDLAIEGISPSETALHVGRKITDYLEEG